MLTFYKHVTPNGVKVLRQSACLMINPILRAGRKNHFFTQPRHRVPDNLQRDRFKIDLVGFVAGTEVEDLSFAQVPKTAAAKMFTTIPLLLEEIGIV